MQTLKVKNKKNKKGKNMPHELRQPGKYFTGGGLQTYIVRFIRNIPGEGGVNNNE